MFGPDLYQIFYRVINLPILNFKKVGGHIARNNNFLKNFGSKKEIKNIAQGEERDA